MFTPVPVETLRSKNNFLQSHYWSRMKASQGLKPMAFEYNNNTILVFIIDLYFGFSLAYIPHGPESEIEGAFLTMFARELKKQLPGKVVLIRFDFPWNRESSISVEKPFSKSVVDIQPPSTVLIDLTQGEESILKGMKSKTRYNVRLAEKKGVTIREGRISGAGGDDLDLWYDLYKVTAERDRIAIHTREYYRSVAVSTRDTEAEVKLFLAEVDHQIVSGIIVLKYGSRATYLYGASSNEKRNLMPNYLVQWHALKWARSSGCSEYDLFGIPEDDSPDHPMHGLYRFKTGFGGTIIHRMGCYDFPCIPLLFNLYRIIEKARNYYYKVMKKK